LDEAKSKNVFARSSKSICNSMESSSGGSVSMASICVRSLLNTPSFVLFTKTSFSECAMTKKNGLRSALIASPEIPYCNVNNLKDNL